MKNLIRQMAIFTLITVLAPGCRVTEPHRPLPPGHAEIRVEFKSIPTKTYNKLDAFVTELALKNSTLSAGSSSSPNIGDGQSFHGWLNSGYSVQQYIPNHPVPSPEVERAMQERLKAFLKDNKLEPDDAKLELRYGK